MKEYLTEYLLNTITYGTIPTHWIQNIAAGR
jgi:hypothetical protein